MSKSYVTLLRCPWCRQDGPILLDRRLKDSFENMHTEDTQPCEKCQKEESVIVYDADTKELLAFIKKDMVLNKEALKEHKGHSVKALGKINADGTVTLK